MKVFLITSISSLLLFVSCQSIQIVSDYETNLDFTNYKTYAFHKQSIDQDEISDLDKRRILRAIESQLDLKGFTKSEKPDVLVGISTKAIEKAYVSQMNYGWGMGWNPWFYGGSGYNYINYVTEGILSIDIIETKTNHLIWQGTGQGILGRNPQQKEAKINEFVTKILTQYPPQVSAKK